MTWIIDGHQDIACEAILHCRDYKRPVAAARAAEPDDPTNRITLGYPEYREAGIGIIFPTVFLEKIADGPDNPIPAVQYRNGDEFHRAALAQLDFYRRWNDRINFANFQARRLKFQPFCCLDEVLSRRKS